MRILAIDVGTGTQDILLLDTDSTVENAVKLVMPSPTLLVSQRVRRATKEGKSLLFEGTIMGGGPSMWALRDHAAAGLPTFATPDAARTLDDDPVRVRDLGVLIVSGDEAARLRVDERVRSGDLMLDAVQSAIQAFGADPHFDLLAVAVFDHGNAPADVSDRKFRFDYLSNHLSGNLDLASLAHQRGEIPVEMTRMQGVEHDSPSDVPLLIMDTGPVAILGALEDPQARPSDHASAIIVNIGNFHTLAFHMTQSGVAGLFEHHTGEITAEQLEDMITRLGSGTLSNEAVFDSMGHGALMINRDPPAPSRLSVLGPQRNLLYGSRLTPYLASPHGDQMVGGCYGLCRAVARRMPDLADELEAVLDSVAVRQPDW